MKIGIEPEFIEIIKREQAPPDRPDAGDIRISVFIKLADFSGKYDEIWLDKTELEKFISNLEIFEKERKGEISLNSMSPNEFQIKLSLLQKTGNIKVEILLTRICYVIDSLIPTKLSGGFELRQEYLSALLEDFKKIKS